jgi:hypothetical protein
MSELTIINIEGAQQKSRSVFHPGELAPSGHEVFTKKMREVPVKRGQLTRVPFHVSRLMEFCTQNELVNQTGHAVYDWPQGVLKELIDNGLDACEEAGITPIISVEVKGDKIVIADNGPGIPAIFSGPFETLESGWRSP